MKKPNILSVKSGIAPYKGAIPLLKLTFNKKLK